MRQSPTIHSQRPVLIGLSILLLTLAGCSSTPEQTTGTAEITPIDQSPIDTGNQALQLPASEFSAQFEETERRLLAYDWMAASSVLDTLPTESLSSTDLVYRDYLLARIAYIRGEEAEAVAILQRLDYPGANPALLYRARNLHRHILSLSGDKLESARLGDIILRTAPSDAQPALKRDIWHNLEGVDPDLLQAAMPGADPQWLGWLQLANLSRETRSDLRRRLSLWRDSNPTHPAAAPLPGGLDYLIDQDTQIEKVALLLPLSGRLAPAGKAVRDGYLASYYAARSAGLTDHQILVVDTNDVDTAQTAYYEALLDDVNLVIGPLSKQAVASLGMLVDRPVPVLALNSIDQRPNTESSALVQFSLAPEDEAREIARQAFGKGARRAMVIRPVGSWGDKLERALREEWTSLGGTIASSTNYENQADYSNDVKAGLGLPASEQRGRQIRDLMATEVEVTARRRQDLDAVFLLTRNSADARSLKPLLAFHYAGSLPVYALSTAYSGIPSQCDRDLNGINLVEIPWLLGANPEARVAIAAGDTGTDNYTRLNALGADAFLLQQNFARLQAGPDAVIRGNTGLLTMDSQLRIHRELPLATFDRGELKAR